MVQRCSWFYRGPLTESWTPFEESLAEKIEQFYCQCLAQQQWHKSLMLTADDVIVVHSESSVLYFSDGIQPDEFGNVMSEEHQPNVVHRGFNDFHIEEGEPDKIDHLVFVVHGIGPVHTENLFSGLLEDCVADMRRTCVQLVESHFVEAKTQGRLGRVEFLPVYWYCALHSKMTQVDEMLARITLGSTRKMRDFINDTLIDVLLYFSPIHAKQISQTVGNEMNRIYSLFCARNPGFNGGVSVCGHSLGCLILFDLLSHQGVGSVMQPVESEPKKDDAEDSADGSETAKTTGDGSSSCGDDHLERALADMKLDSYVSTFQRENVDFESLLLLNDDDLKELGLPLGSRRKLLSFIEQQNKKKKSADSPSTSSLPASCSADPLTGSAVQVFRAGDTQILERVDHVGIGTASFPYCQLNFSVGHFFALGSPIGMFLVARGSGELPTDYKLPTCGRFYNIFHPYDPFAYRMEPMFTLPAGYRTPDTAFQLPHHKGRKRMHLQLRDSLTRFSSDIKARLYDAVRNTWSSFYEFAQFHVGGNANVAAVGSSEQQRLEEAVEIITQQSAATTLTVDNPTTSATTTSEQIDQFCAKLNNGSRIDFALQEAPFESFNDYLFALSSHVCYWRSEDTSLKILTEIYSQLYDIQPQFVPAKQSEPTAAASPPQTGPPRMGPPPPMSTPLPAPAMQQTRPMPSFLPPNVQPTAPRPPPPSGPFPSFRPPLSSGALPPGPAPPSGPAPLPGLPPPPGPAPSSGPTPSSGPAPPSGPPPLSGFVRTDQFNPLRHQRQF